MVLRQYSVKMRDSLKAEIETVVEEVGLWHSRSEFVREAIDEHIKKYWKGPRFEK